jgi:hypothetical protein
MDAADDGVGARHLAAAIATGEYLARGGRSSYGTDDNPGVGWFTLGLTSSTNPQETRGLTGSSTGDVGWSVVQFRRRRVAMSQGARRGVPMGIPTRFHRMPSLPREKQISTALPLTSRSGNAPQKRES